jgi:hypothetical protein
MLRADMPLEEAARMNSQRAREARIVEKLGSGALSPATSAESAVRAALETKPSAAGCHGCDELEADTLVGGQPWHHRCLLFWRGRSEFILGRPAPNARLDACVTPERPRWVIVVRAGRPAVYARLRRHFAGTAWVEVVTDRRSMLPSGNGGDPTVERRRIERGRGSATSAPVPVFRRAYREDDYEVYETTAPLMGRCPQCGRLVTMELPRFAEPPVRLELLVVHETISPATVRHVVEAQSLSATGRILLASRLLARPGPESM